MPQALYRGRLAPTPSGRLHLGHARTFYWAHRRARERQGLLFLRLENLDQARCKSAYAQEIIEDLQSVGLDWDGKILYQSQRLKLYRAVLRRLYCQGKIYVSPHSRQDLAAAPLSRHGEPLFPKAWRCQQHNLQRLFPDSDQPSSQSFSESFSQDFSEDFYRQNWRFAVPDDYPVQFTDGQQGAVTFTAGVDFADFLVWRKDGIPSYELAVVADDAAQRITEVVRGADLLLSTARQLLLYQALDWKAPAFFHLPLLLAEDGEKLAKSKNSPALRDTPPDLRQNWLTTWSKLPFS